MSDPAREEDHWAGAREVGRIEALQEIAMNEVARMVEHHDDHHDTAQQIDGIDARTRRLYWI